MDLAIRKASVMEERAKGYAKNTLYQFKRFRATCSARLKNKNLKMFTSVL